MNSLLQTTNYPMVLASTSGEVAQKVVQSIPYGATVILGILTWLALLFLLVWIPVRAYLRLNIRKTDANKANDVSAHQTALKTAYKLFWTILIIIALIFIILAILKAFYPTVIGHVLTVIGDLLCFRPFTNL